jgi:hypothetical protein
MRVRVGRLQRRRQPRVTERGQCCWRAGMRMRVRVGRVAATATAACDRAWAMLLARRNEDACARGQGCSDGDSRV